MERSTRCPSGAVVVILWLLGGIAGAGMPHDLGAQEPTFIRGRVLDRETRVPVAGAFVGLTRSDSGVLTDSLGVFTLGLLRDFDYALTVESLGYRTMEVVLNPTAPDEFTTILLPPDPVAIQGLTVLVDRFERRRRTYFGSVRVIDQDRLLNGGPGTAYDLLQRSVPFARPCLRANEDLCMIRRGREQVVRVCIDERPAFAGARELEGFDSRELYLVELYDWGSQVRVYSRWYVDRMLSEGRSLKPLSFGC